MYWITETEAVRSVAIHRFHRSRNHCAWATRATAIASEIRERPRKAPAVPVQPAVEAG